MGFVTDSDDYLIPSDLFDIIWKKQYGTLKHEKCYGIIETMDKGYFLYGYQDTDTTSAEFYCVKTDSLGVEEWTQTYSLQGSSVAFSAHQTADKGYIISGYGYHQTKSYQMYIVRTDSVGNQLWEKDYGGNGGDGGGLLIPLEDGNYMLTGNIEENNYYKQYIAKISSIGDVIWDKKLTMGQYLVFEAFKKTQDGLFIASGSQRDYLFEYPTNGIAVKFNSNGDTLWTKTYKTYSDDKDYFRDIEPTADGGFLMAGFNYTQHGSWLVKTDSLGNTCSYLGCDSLIEDTISAIHFTTQKNPYQISLSPNPAINYTEISYYLPTKHPLAHFKLYNLRGATVLQQELTTFKHKKKLDITKFQSGIYVYEVLYQGQKAYSGKLIVE